MTDSFKRMVSRRFSGWQKAVALAPVLLLLFYLPGQLMLRCRIDGLLRPTCCCPQGSEPQSSGPVVKAQDCCDREVSQNQRPAAEAVRPAGRDLAAFTTAAFVVASGPLVIPPTERLDWGWRRQGPVREGPPIVLLKHAFLI
jgi:hypothetical protein